MSSVSERYELRGRLGAGGMGEVYRAWDRALEREVALKLVRADLPAGSQGRERLLREARLAANLSHPNICVVHDVGEMDGRPFVTMELLRGETLRRLLGAAPWRRPWLQAGTEPAGAPFAPGPRAAAGLRGLSRPGGPPHG